MLQYRGKSSLSFVFCFVSFGTQFHPSADFNFFSTMENSGDESKESQKYFTVLELPHFIGCVPICNCVLSALLVDFYYAFINLGVNGRFIL